MGIQFHETVYGKRFFEDQLPSLIQAINRLADVKKAEPKESASKNEEAKNGFCEKADNETRDRLRAAMENEEMSERLGEAFVEAVDSDDEKPRRMGYYLAKAVLDDNVEDLLVAVCGWTSKSLLNLAEFGEAYPTANK